MKIVLIKDERYSYSPAGHANNSDTAVNAVHYKASRVPLIQMTELEAFMENDE